MRLLLVITSLLLVGGPQVALGAPDDPELVEASQHFQRGKAAFAAKRYVEAATAFGEAFAIVPDAGTAFNAALAWESAKDPARAGDAYLQAIETGGLDSTRESDARRALGQIESKLARVTVSATAEARISLAYRDSIGPITVHVAPGRYQAVATFVDGARATRTIDVERGPVAVEIAPTPVGAVAARPVGKPRPVAPPSDAGAVRRAIGFASLGLGVAGGATAIALGVLAIDARDEFEAGGRRSRELHDDAAGLRIGTNVAWGLAGAFVITGTVLVATSFDAGQPATVALCVGPTRFAVCGSF